MEKSPEINELMKALAIAQGTMGGAIKDASNPFFKSKYADLNAVIEAIKEPFSKNGLAYTQLVESKDGVHCVTTILGHASGQFISGTVNLKLSKEDMQGLGSAISYARRYGLQAIAGLSAEDDDGEAAVGRTTKDVVAKAVEETKNTPLPDFELDSLAHIVFKSKKTLLQNWLLKTFGKTKMTDLSQEEIKKAVSLLTDMKDNGIDPTV